MARSSSAMLWWLWLWAPCHGALHPWQGITSHDAHAHVDPSRPRLCGTVPPSCAPNCGEAITSALHACSAAGGGTVQLTAGVYHLNDSLAWAGRGQQLIKAQDLTDVSLVGATTAISRGYNHSQIDPRATTLLVYGLRGAVTVFRSRRVRFVDLDIDMARLPYTFGYVSAATDDTMTVKFDPSIYPFEAPVQSWTTTVTNVQEFDRGDWRMNASLGGGQLPVVVDSVGQLTLSGLGTSAGIRVGKWYILRNAYYDACGFAGGNNSGVHIERVTMWAAGGMGFAFSTTLDIEMVDVAVTRRPGLALSATADGTHFNECGGHLHFKRLRVEGQGDDGMNVHGAFHDVRAFGANAHGSNHSVGTMLSVTLGNRPAGSATELTELTVGARYEFRNRHTFEVEGIGVLQTYAAVAPPTSRLQTATFVCSSVPLRCMVQSGRLRLNGVLGVLAAPVVGARCQRLLVCLVQQCRPGAIRAYRRQLLRQQQISWHITQVKQHPGRENSVQPNWLQLCRSMVRQTADWRCFSQGAPPLLLACV